MPTYTQIIQTLQPYLLGAIGGLSSTLATGLFNEFFEERKRKAKHKLNIARQVLKICNEASTGNFKSPPRDIEHINSVLTDIDGIDKKIGEIMTTFVTLWGRIIEYTESQTSPNQSTKHFVQMSRDVEAKRVILIDWANKIRAGK